MPQKKPSTCVKDPFIPTILAHRECCPQFQNLVSTGTSSGVKIFLQTADISISHKGFKIACSGAKQVLKCTLQINKIGVQNVSQTA